LRFGRFRQRRARVLKRGAVECAVM
jgi:hypothetical protein